MGIRDKGEAEKGDYISKSNYGSRKNYTIESALLEKMLIYD